ncbi:MAG TPA: Tim44/TimA family putative adaptor protein [Rhizomicrobium sp.]|nr:Tim44/TimA family putative adaptor protein [Rhizomicrobium sp.]
MANSQLLYILLLAMVAGVILFRLYTVLGRRTGNERPQQDRFQALAGAEKPVSDSVTRLPDRSAENVQAVAGGAPAGLLDIKLADRTFDPGHFLDGARHAYEMIVTAFAQGDRATLRPLLNNDVYAAFEKVIEAREAKREKVAFTLVGFQEVKIIDAILKTTLAEVTVSFGAQFISSTTDASGSPIEGDPKSVRSVTDIWTFERNVRSSDPNWRLVGTSGEAELQGH